MLIHMHIESCASIIYLSFEASASKTRYGASGASSREMFAFGTLMYCMVTVYFEGHEWHEYDCSLSYIIYIYTHTTLKEMNMIVVIYIYALVELSTCSCTYGYHGVRKESTCLVWSIIVLIDCACFSFEYFHSFGDWIIIFPMHYLMFVLDCMFFNCLFRHSGP